MRYNETLNAVMYSELSIPHFWRECKEENDEHRKTTTAGKHYM